MDTDEEVLHIHHNGEQAVKVVVTGRLEAIKTLKAKRLRTEGHVLSMWEQLRQGCDGGAAGCGVSGRAGWVGGVGFYVASETRVDN
ncbi:hypothetical protein E2C01_002057 [Portunus trituberculatus]|uniref:Uncharacterized protein n=1 Tax=Portunus trituberculatus TaxID=210409 RepID=A0A5B7CM12_PORTR|nr:hypothetical protein [Portunus trituberculatus]